MIIILKDANFTNKNVGRVEISDKLVASITIEGNNSAIGMNNAANYKCLASYDDGTSEYVMPQWSISAGGSYASIDANGNVNVQSGANSSSVTITASYQGKSATKNITATYEMGLNAFTLSAITASGNTSMSDTKKMALNDFFKNLGAFGGGSNIWNKMDRVYMPILATSVSMAGHDYTEKGGSFTPNADVFQLRNGGLVSKLSTEASTSVPTVSMTINQKDLSVFHVMMEGGSAGTQSAFRIGYNGNSGSNRCYITPSINTGGTGYIMNMEHVTPSGAKLVVDCSKPSTGSLEDIKYKLCGFSLTGTADASVLKLDGTIAQSTYANFSNLGSDTANVNAYFFGNASGKIATQDAISEGIILMGKGLSNAEINTLKSAVEKLVDAFK